MLAIVPTLPATRPTRPASRPAPAEIVATWATIVLVLLAFWYGVGVGVTALWHQLAG